MQLQSFLVASYFSPKRASQRGAIALMAGLMLPPVILITFGMIYLGLQATVTHDANNQAEALAIAQGYEVLSRPSPTFGDLSDSSLVADNGTHSDAPVSAPAVPLYTNDGPVPLLEAPGYQVGTTAHVSSTYDEVDAAAAGTQIGAQVRSFVNQYQWSRLTVVPVRIMLVLDYSKSMRLHYSGGDPVVDSALHVIRRAAEKIIQDPNLEKRVNWGLVRFSTAPDSVIDFVPTATFVAPDSALIQHRNDLLNELSKPTFGDDTDLAQVVDTARSYMPHGATDGSDPFTGKAIMIIITDGEPTGGGSPGDAYDARVAKAKADAILSIQDAWRLDGIQTVPLIIQREATSTAPPLDFLKEITGDGDGQGNGSAVGWTSDRNDKQIAAASGDMTKFLTLINPRNRCIAAAPVFSTSSWMQPPQLTDLIFGYWVPSGNALTNEIAVGRVAALNNALMDPAPSTDGSFDPHLANFYFYPPGTGKAAAGAVEVNASVCYDYSRALATGRPLPRFRIRWGVPRIAQNGAY